MARCGIWVACLLALAACERADPLARARADCANAALAPLAQVEACGTLITSGGLESAAHAEALANTGAALRDFAAALALDDANAPALEGRARILIASGQFGAAEPLVERLIATNAAGARAHLLQGQIAAGRSDYAAALDAFDTAVGEEPHNLAALVGRARMEEALSDGNAAMADFSAAIAIDPHSPDARAGRCWLTLNQLNGGAQHDDTQAREDAEEAVARAPRDFSAQTCWGVLHLRASEWAQAQQSFDAALTIQPGDALALFGRGVARRRGGDGAGLTDMNQARDFNHHIGERYDQLGVATY